MKPSALATKLLRQLDVRHRDGRKKNIQAHRKRLNAVQRGSHSMASLVKHLRDESHGHEGRGVSGTVQGHRVAVGRPGWLTGEMGAEVPEAVRSAVEKRKQNKTKKKKKKLLNM